MAVLEVQDLSVTFDTPSGPVSALTGATFSMERGEVLAVVGESGSGKTVLANAILQLLPMNASVSGSVRLLGQELMGVGSGRMRAIRARDLALIPQSPAAALNPVRRVGSLAIEFACARGLGRREAPGVLRELLAEFGLDWDLVARRYPHQLSGGMQQRLVNVLALIGSPAVVLADEPTSGLDPVLVEALSGQLREIAGRGAAVLLITHDLRLARAVSTRLALVYASYIVELRPTADFFAGPLHPYGRDLLGALPENGSMPIRGLPPELTRLPRHCPYAPRCGQRLPECNTVMPATQRPRPDSAVRCLLHA